MAALFTEREKTVWHYQQEGKNIRQIAETLSISHHTVKAILCSVQNKLAAQR